MINESLLVKKLIRLALEEDLGFGDITSTLTIAEDATGVAEICAKEDLVVCGLDIIPMVFHLLGGYAETEFFARDGDLVESPRVIARVVGNTRDLLGAERTILNFLQRMCGVATATRELVEQSPNVAVLDTRKTIPGWRVLDKYAVSVGGGKNHRMNLGDMIMIKNNHIDAATGETATEKLSNCLKSVLAKKPFFMPVEVEVRNLEELRTALSHKVAYVMFDNMTNDQIRQGIELIERVSPTTQAEISGNMTLERLKMLQRSGVKCASFGSLTTQAGSVDISMRISAKKS